MDQKEAEDRRIQANNLLQLGTLLFISVVAENLLMGNVSPFIIISIGIVVAVIYIIARNIMKGVEINHDNVAFWDCIGCPVCVLFQYAQDKRQGREIAEFYLLHDE